MIKMKNGMRWLIVWGLVVGGVGLGEAIAQSSTLRSGDKIQVMISDVPTAEVERVSGLYVINEAGVIDLPLITTIRAAGLTADALAAQIRQTYIGAEIYTRPGIQVVVDAGEGLTARMVWVGGKVAQPRRVPYVEGMLLLDAINECGGPTPFANMSKVRLSRGTPQGDQETEHNMKRGRLEDNVAIRPDDRIYVP
jgi:polysaccharide biosynthesis/export protein